ncbi:MAG: SDR family oxidoreductase [Pirellulaceae bacterium]
MRRCVAGGHRTGWTQIWDVNHPAPGTVVDRVRAFAPQALIHLAAISIPADCGSPRPTDAAIATNVDGTRHALELADALPSLDTFMLASSCHVYRANPHELLQVDEQAETVPSSGYGWTKLWAEEAVRQHPSRAPYDRLIVRGFCSKPVPGNPQVRLIVPGMARWPREAMATQGKMPEHGARSADIRDTAAMQLDLLGLLPACGVFNLASGMPTSGEQLMAEIELVSGRRVIVESQIEGPRYNPIADMRKMRETLGSIRCRPLRHTITDMWATLPTTSTRVPPRSDVTARAADGRAHGRRYSAWRLETCVGGSSLTTAAGRLENRDSPAWQEPPFRSRACRDRTPLPSTSRRLSSMILTGKEIQRRMGGDIDITPFDESRLNPNSYNLTLHNELMIYEEIVLDMRQPNRYRSVTVPDAGLVLSPNQLYLGRTVERTKTKNLVPMIEGRSSVGRLRLFVHVTAGFGDAGFEGFLTWRCSRFNRFASTWDPDCQIFYHEVVGDIVKYKSGKYQNNSGIQPSLLYGRNSTRRLNLGLTHSSIWTSE